jgi:hypothetical protein
MVSPILPASELVFGGFWRLGEMVKTSQKALAHVEVPDDDGVLPEKGAKPDYLIKVRQPPKLNTRTGKMERNENFTIVGAAWRKRDRNGVEFIAATLHVADLTFKDNGFVMYPPKEEKED